MKKAESHIEVERSRKGKTNKLKHAVSEIQEDLSSKKQ